MKLLLFSAKKQGGKNTVAIAIKEKYADKYDIVEINFADRLKEIVLDLFVPVEWEWATEDLDVSKDKMLPQGKTVRETLQWFGTDICRKAYPDVWVNAWKRNIQQYIDDETCPPYPIETEYLILVADCRFANEVKAGQDLGGHVIRLLRAPFPEDKHVSETALDLIERFTIEKTVAVHCIPSNPKDDNAEGQKRLLANLNIRFDAIIDNREMTIAEQNEAVWKLVKEKKWI